MTTRLQMEIKVYEDLEEIGQETLHLLKGPVVGLSGGSTYTALLPYWREALAIQALSFFPVDERIVPFQDENSNWRMVWDKLLEPLGLEEQRHHHAVSAVQYRQLLVDALGPEVIFDQIFLGMGDDGHTASLFPGSEALDDTQSIVLETRSPKPPHERVTLGLRPIWNARELITIITGVGKCGMVHRLLAGDTSLPITVALQGHPNPVLILDRAAAGDLKGSNVKYNNRT